MAQQTWWLGAQVIGFESRPTVSDLCLLFDIHSTVNRDIFL